MSKNHTSAHTREVGLTLRKLRIDAGLDAQDVARGIDWTTVKVSRVETGKQRITPIEVAVYAMYCGAVGKQLAEILDLAHEDDTDHRFRRHHGELPDELRSLIIEESTAAHIADYEPVLVPGLAQTEDYARTLIIDGNAQTKDQIDTRVRARMARQGLIKKIDPTQCRFVIHEHALRSMVGSPAIMHEQLLHLVFLGGRPQCEVRVVPLGAPHHGIAPHSFRIMRYVDHPPIIYLQTVTASVFLEKQPDIDTYQALMKRIDAIALDDVRSREMLVRIAGEYELMGDGIDGDGGVA
jgi:hypothetical protein